MPLKISTDPAPLVTDEDGVVRVEGTRVRLDTVVFAFNQGASAEEILQQYPSLTLSDIYATISYYLQHRSAVDEYLRERQLEHDRVRQLIAIRSCRPSRTPLETRAAKLSMLRFAADEDFDNRIVRGLLRLLV